MHHGAESFQDRISRMCGSYDFKSMPGNERWNGWIESDLDRNSSASGIHPHRDEVWDSEYLGNDDIMVLV